MSMPGMNAEASLYKTSQHYRTGSTFNQANYAGIRPAQLLSRRVSPPPGPRRPGLSDPDVSAICGYCNSLCDTYCETYPSICETWIGACCRFCRGYCCSSIV